VKTLERIFMELAKIALFASRVSFAHEKSCDFS
jgi:hypothetical protein